jgi:hypothetical protein
MATQGSTHQLEFLSGPLQGRSVTLRSTMVVGRLAGECDLVVADASVSRRHARLELAPEGLRVVDEGSRNGVWLGAKRVSEAIVRPGEEFKLGEVRVAYRAAASVAEPGSPRLDLDLELPDIDLPELELPGPDRLGAALPASAAPARASAPPAASDAQPPLARPTPARASERASAAATRGILQYSRHEQSAGSGWAQGDFAQLPAWMKAAAIALALAVFALVFVLAFKGGAWLRGAGGASASEAQVEDG